MRSTGKSIRGRVYQAYVLMKGVQGKSPVLLWHCLDRCLPHLRVYLGDEVTWRARQVCLLPGMHLHASIQDSFKS